MFALGLAFAGDAITLFLRTAHREDVVQDAGAIAGRCELLRTSAGLQSHQRLC